MGAKMKIPIFKNGQFSGQLNFQKIWGKKFLSAPKSIFKVFFKKYFPKFSNFFRKFFKKNKLSVSQNGQFTVFRPQINIPDISCFFSAHKTHVAENKCLFWGRKTVKCPLKKLENFGKYFLKKN